MDNLNELMEHIDYFFQDIPSAYDSDRRFEVYLTEGRWLITDKSNEKAFGTTKYEDALGFLKEANVDLLVLHSLLHDKVCTEGVLRRMQIEKCEELVGAEAITRSEESWAAFADGLKTMVEAVTTEREDAPKTGLMLVDE